MKRVAITHSNNDESWYHELVGHFFRVTEYTKETYLYKKKFLIEKNETVKI